MPTLTRKQNVAIVDAYSGGRNLIPAFQAIGYPVIHIQSGEVPTLFVKDNELARRRADQHVVFTDDVDDLVRTLRAASVTLVLPGSEGGVLLADRLASMLDLPFRNEVALSTARRNKFYMQERLREVGLPCITHTKVADVDQLDSWLETHGKYPVVVKPLQSAGTEAVSICHSRDEARNALDTVLSAPDMFGNANNEALCQELLVGHEYVINGIACQGQYAYTEGWRSDKVDNGGYPVYDTQYLFYVGDPGFDEISQYVADVCRALGIMNGPFHAEVMLTPAGPILIEIAARVAGGADPYVIESCLGHSQISQLVVASLHAERYLMQTAVQAIDRPFQRAAYIYLIAISAGHVRRVQLEDFLEVEGVLCVDYHYAEGDRQEMTRDLITSAGVVIVTAADSGRLDAAVQSVREIEHAMYEANVEPLHVP
ncbi:MAG: ATP-grasp domain-containing protein [Actinomycetota bacterium]|nr:ATP-grasp domain-containing protein [Actinomycetota bacterium]